MGEDKKIFWKHWTGVLVMVAIAGLVVFLLANLGEVINAVQKKYLAQKERQQLEELQRPYKEDKYGGKTPEETFDLFITALKKEDIDLASKYFVIPKQESWKETLGEYEKNGLLANFYVELEQSREKWQKKQTGNPDIIEFNEYVMVDSGSKLKFKDKEFDVPAGNYLNITRFEKYPSGIWKISVL